MIDESQLESLRAEFTAGASREAIDKAAGFIKRMNEAAEDFSGVPTNILAHWFFSTGCQALLCVMTEDQFRARLRSVADAPEINRGSEQSLRDMISAWGE